MLRYLLENKWTELENTVIKDYNAKQYHAKRKIRLQKRNQIRLIRKKHNHRQSLF